MKILVTGCCGFIGSHLTERLLSEGHEVFGIDNINDYYDIKAKYRNLNTLEKYDRFTFKKGKFLHYRNGNQIWCVIWLPWQVLDIVLKTQNYILMLM